MTVTGGNERTIRQLVSDATTDAKSIVQGEIELAKLEIKSDIAKAGKGGGMFAGAAVFGLFALWMLLLAAAWGIHASGLSLWLSLLIVGVALLVIAGLLALIGKSAFGKIQGKPAKTIETSQQAVAALKAPKA